MNEDRTNRVEHDDEVGRLLGSAGRRSILAEEEVAPIREVAREAWRRGIRKPPAPARRPWLVASLAAAAALVLAILIATRRPGEVPLAPVTVATFEAVRGTVAVSGMTDAPMSGMSIVEAMEVRTGGDGLVALRVTGGSTVRLDVDSSLAIDSGRRMTLSRGALYVDSEPGTGGTSTVEVVTLLGSVQHVGTQYEVRLLEDNRDAHAQRALRVRVREGAVRVRRAGSSWDAGKGNELIVRADGRIERAELPIHGPDWEWVHHAAPPLVIEGRSLEAFLGWVRRESGLDVRFNDPGLAATANGIVLHGTLSGVTPEEALSIVLPACGLELTRTDGAIVLDRNGGAALQ